MIHMLVHLIIFLLIVGGLCWLVSLTPIPAVIKNVIYGVVVLVLIIWLLMWIDNGGLQAFPRSFK